MPDQIIECQFYVVGKVQGVFFRKTFVKTLRERGLSGGATNDRENRNRVFCTAIGTLKETDDLKQMLKSTKKFNSLGAYIEALVEENHGISWHQHDASTKD